MNLEKKIQQLSKEILEEDKKSKEDLLKELKKEKNEK